MNKEYGRRTSRMLTRRLAVSENAPNWTAVPKNRPEMRHTLKGRRTIQQAVDTCTSLSAGLHTRACPLIKRPDGGLDEERGTAITIIKVADYY